MKTTDIILIFTAALLFLTVAAILSAFLGYALVNAADTYIRQKHVYHHIEVRVQLFTRQFTRKICEIPQE